MSDLKISGGVRPATAYIEFEDGAGFTARNSLTLAELRDLIEHLTDVEQRLVAAIRAEESNARY